MADIAQAVGLDPDVDAETSLALLGVDVEDILAELDARRQAKVKEAHARQRLAAKVQSDRKVIRAGEIGGECTMQVDPVFYHYWGQRLGYECWSDATFVREFKRDNPEVRVRSRVENPTIVVDGFKGAATGAAAKSPAAVRGKRGRWAL